MATDAIGASGQQHRGAQVWVSPGVSLRKRLLTAAGVALVTALFIFIAVYENASMFVSTLIGVIFIGCFVWYLFIVAPKPYTLRVDPAALTRAELGARHGAKPGVEPVVIPWAEVARVKEERFKKGTSVSFALYRRSGERNVYRALVVYRDDIPRFDDFLAAVRARLPAETPWRAETVHE